MTALLVLLGTLSTACELTPGQGDARANPEGELRVRTFPDPALPDPQKTSNSADVAQIALVFSSLMTFDPQTLKPVPDAAREPPSVSSDGRTYTFTLKDGLTYSDGTPLRAKDFVYGFKRLCDPRVDSPYASSASVVQGCAQYHAAKPDAVSPEQLADLRERVAARARDDRTIEYTLVERAPYFLSIMALAIAAPTREDMVTKGGDRWTEPETYVGNGWFVLTEWTHDRRIVFERNERHSPRAKLKRIVEAILPDVRLALAAYRNNELDLYGGPLYGVVGAERQLVEADSELTRQLVKSDAACTRYYGFNTLKPPFDDPKVRLAFAKAFDREAYVRDVESGIGVSNPSFIPPGLPGHDPADDTQKFDPSAAKRLLAESAYATKLPALNFTFANTERLRVRAEWIVGQWKQQLGLDVLLDPVPPATYSAYLRSPATRPQLFTTAWCADYPDPQNWLTTLFSSSSTQSSHFITGYSSESFDRLTRQADGESDPTKREDLYRQAQRILTQDAPAAFVFSSQTWTLVKPWVHGYRLTALDSFFSQFALGALYVTR